MKRNMARLAVIFAVMFLLTLIIPNRKPCCGSAVALSEEAQKPAAIADKGNCVPSLIDLGRTMCIPCKMMAPILDELQKECAGKLKVEFIDVGKNPEAARKYEIRAIPTQVFLDAAGKEIYRHIGFYAKEDILNKWKELGVDLSKAKSQ